MPRTGPVLALNADSCDPLQLGRRGGMHPLRGYCSLDCRARGRRLSVWHGSHVSRLHQSAPQTVFCNFLSKKNGALMKRFAAVCLVAYLVCPSVGWAQTPAEPPETATSPVGQQPPAAAIASEPAPSESSRQESSANPGFWAPFKSVPNDFVRFFSADVGKVVGVGGASALATYRWDAKGIEESQEHFRPNLFRFRTGNIGGSLLVQAGASFGLYSIAKLTGAEELTNFSGDMVRAQLLTQGLVQAGKFATHRLRPDGSNNFSLPSGHAAAAFATATVVQRHFGWKLGVPAYAFGAYVGASRMAANKHHLSDVVLGATIGIAAGRTVAIGRGKGRLQIGVAPTLGGAAIMFTRK